MTDLKLFLRIMIFFTLSNQIILSQEKTNLEIFNRLTDKIAFEVWQQVSSENDSIINLKINLAGDYQIFESRLVAEMTKIEKRIQFSPRNEELGVILTIENSFVNYGEPSKDGLFGTYYVTRSISLAGNYFIRGKQINPIDFFYTNIDTISLDNIQEFENEALKFTKGKKPEAPFFSTILEPIIITSSAAAAIYLFFSIRSK
jgi:hypothetical protein